jgi:hypothetical protein
MNKDVYGIIEWIKEIENIEIESYEELFHKGKVKF